MDPDVDPYLDAGEVTVGERDVALLRAVGREGALNAATADLGRSYSRAHSRLRTLEDELGQLVERERGGAGGGGSELTATARDLLATYADLADALDGTATTEHATVVGEVVDREGELATVQTPAGTVRAVYAGDAERVRVRFPADAVTLHPAEDAPPEDATSARNRFPGTVADVDGGTATASIAVDVGAGAPLVVRVTRSSVDTLGLAPGTDVVATVKATATRAIPIADGRAPSA
jgi:molybdate transport system regulatory protein